MGDLIEPPAPTELTQAPVRREEDEELVGIRAGSSAKIDQLVHLLKLTPATEKSLVFSQFTSFLDKVGFRVPIFNLRALPPACLSYLVRQIAETLDEEGYVCVFHCVYSLGLNFWSQDSVLAL